MSSGQKKKDLKQDIFLKSLYSPVSSSDEEKRLSEIDQFFTHSLRISDSKREELIDVGRLIHKISGFKEIAFGIRDEDGMYRYHEMMGFRKEAVDARKKIVYTPRDMQDGSSFKSIRIGKFSQIHLSEFKPFKPGEEETFNHPELLGKSRANPDDMIEGDYLDIFLFGKNREILGWIELSGTKDGKFPPREIFLYTELIASYVALLLIDFQKDSRKIHIMIM